MKPIDWSKPVQTRNGKPLRVLCTDMKRVTFPVICLLEHSDGGETIEEYRLDGSYENPHFAGGSLNAINAPIKKHGWVNVYGSDADYRMASIEIHDTEDGANQVAARGRIACAKIEWTES